MIKLFATDMDHTLLDNESNLPYDFENRVRNIQNSGKMFALVSGRSYENIRLKVGAMANDIIIISDNGAIVVDKGELLHTDYIPKEDVYKILDVVEKVPDSTVTASSKDMAYVLNGKVPEHLEILREFYDDYKIVDDIRSIDDEFVKITVLNVDNNLRNFTDYVDGKLPDSVQAVMSGSMWIDIIGSRVHKGRGVSKILDRYNLKTENYAAFGDYFNDITMIKQAGMGYAVENAHARLKAVADEVIGRHDEDAVMLKIESLIK